MSQNEKVPSGRDSAGGAFFEGVSHARLPVELESEDSSVKQEASNANKTCRLGVPE